MGIPTNTESITGLKSSVSQRRSLFIMLLCIVLALLVFAVYGFTSSSVGGGQVVMPLDDAYIHFQYAHQITVGQAYIYNPGLPPTSGATSFLYPYLLAIGDLLGFRGLNLGWWAMGIGTAALALAAWLVFRIVRLAAPDGLAAVFAAAFTLDGWVSWHFMSGMETGLAVLFVLLTLYTALERRLRLSILALTLLALIRPEGGLLAIISLVVILLQAMREVPVKGARGLSARLGIPPRWLWRREWLLLIIPLIAIGIQPLVNLLLTGSVVASGNAAKSLFGIIPSDVGVMFRGIVGNFLRMWREFLTAHFYASGMALIGWAALAADKRYRLAAVMIFLWLLVGTAAISTLDNAFWHFKRYQMPLIALFFPLAGWGWAFIYTKVRRMLRRGVRRTEPVRLAFVGAIFGALIAVSISSLLRNTLQFISNEALNVGYVVAQPLQMARWLVENADPDARVAVHDVGMMRYVGGRMTIDMVGLTTPGAAAYWRNGPGSVGEFIERERPDLIASYGHEHGVGLGYLQDTDLYAETLASYSVSLDPINNVALAAPTQGIYRPDWTATERALMPSALPQVLTELTNYNMVDSIDVADIASEAEHGYEWHNDHLAGGFPTEYYQFGNVACARESCGLPLMDGGRRINGDELFTLKVRPNENVILITRLHPANAGTFDVYANDQLVGTRVIPQLPGAWLEVPTLIPAVLVTDSTRIRIVPHVGGDYMPYMHWALQRPPGSAPENLPPVTPKVTFQDGAIELYAFSIEQRQQDDGTHTISVTLQWNSGGQAQGDAKIFMHVLGADGNIIGQADVRPGLGGYPPGNWLPGRFSDTISAVVPAGHYRIEIGLYDPVTNVRLVPSGEGVTPDDSVNLGEVEVS